VKLELEKR
jgi:hypothetical protein